MNTEQQILWAANFLRGQVTMEELQLFMYSSATRLEKQLATHLITIRKGKEFIYTFDYTKPQGIMGSILQG